MLNQIIDKWFSKAKRFLFKYKDGFFELPIMSNSPESTIASLAKMPFVKHSKKNETFGTNNPFMNVHVPYHEIVKGLWYMHANAKYKENVVYKRIKDKYLSSDYYMLFLEITRRSDSYKHGLIDGVSYTSSSWVLFKPNAGATNCRFKGDDTTSLTLYFHQDWLENELNNFEKFTGSALKKFFESDAQFIIVPEKIEFTQKIENLSKALFEEKAKGVVNLAKWQNFAFDFFSFFINRYEEGNTSENLFQIAHIDRKRIIHAEKILLDGIYKEFVGIEKIAAEVGLSPTRLKSNFKLVFGETVFQYFRNKQMESAKVLIQKKQIPIKEVAAIFGYKSASKFTAAYKESQGILPSET